MYFCFLAVTLNVITVSVFDPPREYIHLEYHSDSRLHYIRSVDDITFFPPMPTSARKGSVGTAHPGLRKAYRPYRGDQFEVGKKTGLTIPQVQQNSDGFEPFEEVLKRLDGVMPPQPKRKKSIVPVVNPEYDEEDGEMSMELTSMSICVGLIGIR